MKLSLYVRSLSGSRGIFILLLFIKIKKIKKTLLPTPAKPKVFGLRGNNINLLCQSII